METRRKAFAYITRGRELLVFRHVYHPEAGLQVPAGTIEDGELPEEAVLREAWEETGITGLKIEHFLGEHVRDMRDFGIEAWHHRYFYHLVTEAALLETWCHSGERGPDGKPAESGGKAIEFELFWAPLDAVPPLIANHDKFVPALRDTIGI